MGEGKKSPVSIIRPSVFGKSWHLYPGFKASSENPHQLPQRSQIPPDLLEFVLGGFGEQQLVQVVEEVPDAEGHQGIEHWVKQARKAFVSGFPCIPGFPNVKRGP